MHLPSFTFPSLICSVLFLRGYQIKKRAAIVSCHGTPLSWLSFSPLHPPDLNPSRGIRLLRHFLSPCFAGDFPLLPRRERFTSRPLRWSGSSLSGRFAGRVLVPPAAGFGFPESVICPYRLSFSIQFSSFSDTAVPARNTPRRRGKSACRTPPGAPGWAFSHR